MDPSGIRQRLAAILAADVEGYSRLMAHEERGTIAALDAARGVFRTQIESHQGRVIDMAGDSVLAVFETAIGAVTAALDIQQALNAAGAALPDDRRMRFRIGVHLGDLIEKSDGTIYGDGVNVAARLQGLAEPGGVSISGAAQEAVRNRLRASFEDLGEQPVKNILYPVHVFRVHLAEDDAAVGALRQNIRFCTAPDGTRIAIASIGSGPPLLRAAHWLSHVEHDLESPVWRPWLAELSRHHTYTRYDQRGCGLSDSEVSDFSLDAWVGDLEAVVDCLGLSRFPLIGMSQGGSVAITYAVRHPDKISHLILLGAYARGALRRGASASATLEAEMLVNLIRVGWGRDNAAFRQVFTNLFIPGGTPQQHQYWNELERLTASPENAARTLEAFHRVDVSDLAVQLRVPTLVLHARGDARVPFDEGRRLAALIPGARFVPLDSDNHVLLDSEPAWADFLAAVRSFLSPSFARTVGNR